MAPWFELPMSEFRHWLPEPKRLSAAAELGGPSAKPDLLASYLRRPSRPPLSGLRGLGSSRPACPWSNAPDIWIGDSAAPASTEASITATIRIKTALPQPAQKRLLRHAFGKTGASAPPARLPPPYG